MRALWTPAAQGDLAAIDDYYAVLAPAFADRTGRAAIAAAQFLVEHPAAGATVSADRRRWRVAGTPYLLVYRIVPAGVEILRVYHGRQDRPF